MIQLGLQSRTRSHADSPIPYADEVSLRSVANTLGVRLGTRFEVLGAMAMGGMATLFRVRHRVHGGLFAVKVLHQHLQQREEVVAGFRQEAIHIARLADHPNLIPIFDSHFEEELSFHVYPFVEGEDLDRLIARTPLDRGEALHMAAQISSVLCHMESHGIIHGDISPGNIRVDTFGRYRLLDFGLSRDATENAAPLRGGTPRYTSPEQIEGALPGHSSDLYALGLVLCESITGVPLIQGTSFEEIELCHRNGTWSLPEAVQKDVSVSRLLRCLLARRPAERLMSAYELSGALAALGFERPEFRSQKANGEAQGQVRRARLAPLNSDEQPAGT